MRSTANHLQHKVLPRYLGHQEQSQLVAAKREFQESAATAVVSSCTVPGDGTSTPSGAVESQLADSGVASDSSCVVSGADGCSAWQSFISPWQSVNAKMDVSCLLGKYKVLSPCKSPVEDFKTRSEIQKVLDDMFERIDSPEKFDETELVLEKAKKFVDQFVKGLNQSSSDVKSYINGLHRKAAREQAKAERARDEEVASAAAEASNVARLEAQKVLEERAVRPGSVVQDLCFSQVGRKMRLHKRI